MKSLLFIEPLYHQTIKGLKTMTRREGSLKVINDNPDEWEKRMITIISPYTPDNISAVLFRKKHTLEIVTLKTRLKVGDICFLKEPYAIFENRTTGERQYKYRFDNDLMDIPYKNKLFMPADAARAFVKITSVKCERLLDISDEDCIAEGIFRAKTGKYKDYLYKNKKLEQIGLLDSLLEHSLSHRDSFLSLFKFANKIKADEPIKNIWIWVYSYVLCDKYGKELNNG